MKKIVLVLICTAALISCSKQTAEQKEGTFLAKVGNVKITQADYDREFQALPDYAQQLFSDAEGKERFLNEIINKELLYREALKKDLDKSPEFRRKLEEFKKLTLVTELFEKEILSGSKITDQEAREYYDKHKEEFAPITQIKASHILVKTEGEAGKVLERLKKGEKFGDVAKAVSIDTGSARNGGDLGYFTQGQMVPEFEQAAAGLDTGEVSAPVKTQFGYHIIKVIDKKKSEPIEFEKLGEMIAQRLAAERQKDAFEKYLEKLKNSYKIEINRSALSATPQEDLNAEPPQAEPEAGAEKETPKN
jgi:EpsD family peptidyl-prolyl cis-trans isomerase